MRRRGLLKNRRWKLLNIFRMSPNRFGRNRRGISTTIEYVLFISLAITMSLIVYVWLKSYIPKEPLGCSDGVSILLQEYDYNCNADIIKLDLKNNGRFRIDGYFIKATNKSTQTLAIKDLAKYTSRGVGKNFVDYISDSKGDPGGTITDIFNILPLLECQTITGENPCIFSLEIIPLKSEIINERTRTLSCTSARIRQEISCTPRPQCIDSSECVSNYPSTPVCKIETPPDGICVECLTDTPDCGGAKPACTTTNVCVECTATNDDACTGSTPNCDTDPNSLTYQTCVDAPIGPLNTCGDGTPGGTGEQCDDGNVISGDGCSDTCQIETLNLGYFGFESGTQGWTLSGNSNRNTAQNPISQVDDLGNAGGTADININGGTSSILKNFDLTGYITMTISWGGYYHSFDSGGSNNDCLLFKIGSTTINSWGPSGAGCINTITGQDTWISQNVISTDTSLFSSSTSISFVSGMNSASNDNFYIDGISITGKKY